MRWLARCWLGALLLVAVFSPALANDVPLVASVGGSWQVPVWHTLDGGYPAPPAGADDWKAWWAELDDDDPDWAWMPPWPYGPSEMDPDAVQAGPSVDHPLGTDAAGRDVLSRLIHGTRTALMVGLGSALIGLVIGTVLGAWAGYRGGWVDAVVLRLIEVFLCYPVVFLVLALAAFAGNSVGVLVIMLGIASWPGFARLVRGEFLSLRQRDFVAAARGLGISRRAVVWRHMLPQVRGVLAAGTAFAVAQGIAVESTFSFLGLGPGAGMASWGDVLAQGKDHAFAGAWHLLLFPTLALIATTAALHGAVQLTNRVR